ncbi:MAG: hypothetical protein ABJC55_03970, partial [Algoriphagus sp.]
FISGTSEKSYLEGFWGDFAFDTHGYLDPITHFFEKGSYLPHYRMPGYGFWYGLFLLIFPKVWALNFLLLFQAICSGIGVYLLSVLGGKLTGSRAVFLTSYFLLLGTTYTSWYDHYLMSESLTSSFLIFSVYFFVRSWSNPSPWNLIFSGLLFTNLVFLRPVFLPIGGLFIFLVFWKFHYSISKTLRVYILFFIPFLILDGMWIYSGYKKYQKIIPLQESFLGPSQSNVFYEPAFWFTQNWGGNYLWWDPGAEIRYFGVGTDSLEYFDKNQIQFPGKIFTSQFNQDSLTRASERLMDLKLEKNRLSVTQFDRKSAVIYDSFSRFSKSIQEEKPLLYHIESRISLLRQFLFTTKIRNPFYGLKFPWRDQFIRLKSFTYLVTLVLGYMSALILLVFAFKKPVYLILSGIVWYVLFIHPILLLVIENRYLMPSYSFLTLVVVLATFEILNSRKFAKK